jgi:hypothetical protein
VNALERLAVHELLPLEVSVTNVHMMDQLVVLPVGIGQTKACDPLGMEVLDEVSALFALESQQSGLSEILWLTRGEVVWV